MYSPFIAGFEAIIFEAHKAAVHISLKFLMPLHLPDLPILILLKYAPGPILDIIPNICAPLRWAN